MAQIALFRLLKAPVDDKCDPLVAQVTALNETGKAGEIYTPNPASFPERWKAYFPRRR
jgi:hypothetical protein